MDPKSIIKTMCENMYLQMTYFDRNLIDHQVIEDPDLTIVSSPVASDSFNCVLRTHFDAPKNIKQRIYDVKEFFVARSVPFAWWVGPLDEPNNLGECLAEQGLIFDEHLIGMFMPLSEYQSTLSSNLVVRRVLDDGDLRLFDRVHVLSGLFQDAYEKRFKNIPPKLYQEGSPFELYVGIVDGTVAATGMLALQDGVAGIYYIATIPEQRRKGYATAMMNALLSRAQDHGYKYALLQASEMGKNIYRKLGFKDVCTFNIYSLRGTTFQERDKKPKDFVL